MTEQKPFSPHSSAVSLAHRGHPPIPAVQSPASLRAAASGAAETTLPEHPVAVPKIITAKRLAAESSGVIDHIVPAKRLEESLRIILKASPYTVASSFSVSGGAGVAVTDPVRSSFRQPCLAPRIAATIAFKHT
jgi:hypothetical protein